MAQTKKTNGLAKTTTNDVYHPMLINNIFNYYSNNGDGSFNKFSASAEVRDLNFPKEMILRLVFLKMVLSGGVNKMAL